MTSIELLEKDPISIRDLRDELKKIKERDGELSFRGQKCEDYVNTFATLGKQKEKELSEKLASFNIPMMNDNHIKKLINLMPTSEKHVKVIASGFNFQLKNEDAKRIFDAVKEFA